MSIRDTGATARRWSICALHDILPDTGVCALVGGRQVAVFRVGDTAQVFALDNLDPNSGASVLSRGLIGNLGERLVVASPIYKHHFDLRTGECLEKPECSVQAYPASVTDGVVHVDLSTSVVSSFNSQLTTRQRLVVVGNGMAAMRTVEELLARAPELYDITVFGAEPHGNYNRILLSPVLAGEQRPEDIVLHPPAWYAERGITLHAGDPVVSIDRARRRVSAASGREVDYDRLLLATGSEPIVLPLPGRELPGVTTFRDLDDVSRMLDAARAGARAVVIGGGLLGLEAASGLARRGMTVTVVHLVDRLMERQLDVEAAALLQRTLEARGIAVRLCAQTEAILGDTQVTGVRLADGSELPAELVVMAVGIRPNIRLVQAAGLRCERGVLVNDTLQTFDPRVYAVGECVQHRNATYGLVAPLWEQARVCALHLARLGHGCYSGSLLATQLKVSGVEVFSAGDFNGGGDVDELVLRDPRRGVYKRLLLRDNRIVGSVLYGDARDGNWYFELMAQGRDVTPLRDRLLFGRAFCEAA